MKKQIIKFSLVLVLFAAPAIFSACCRCPEIKNAVFSIKQISLKNIGSKLSVDSVFYGDSSGMYLENEVMRIAQEWHFSLGGELMACKCASDVGVFADPIDSVVLIAADPHSSVYPEGTDLTQAVKVSLNNQDFVELKTRNNETAFWAKFHPYQRIFFVIHEKLTVRELRVKFKMFIRGKGVLYSPEFYVVS